MSRTSIIFGALVIGYLVFATLQGHLPGYLYVFGLGSAKPSGC